MSDVDDKALFKALDWLADKARPAAQARANRVYIEESLSHTRAKMALECINAGDSAAAADIKARASDAYRTQLEGLRVAVEEDEFFRWHKTRFDAMVEIWRTLSANKRSIDKVT